jgi:hypothetical protein
MIVTAFNPPLDDLEKTYISTAVSAGATALPVKNNNSFAALDRILVGEQGRERTDLLGVSSVSGATTITASSGTSYGHDPDEPVYRLRYDQVKFYRSTTGSTGTYSVLTTANLDFDNEEGITTYDDTSGLSTYYYKVSYYNSASTLESALSDPVLGAGYVRNSVGFLQDEILREIADEDEKTIDKTELLGYFNECSDDLQTRAKRPYDFLRTRTTLTRTAARNYIDFPTDSSGNQTMWKFDRLDYNFTDSTTSPVTDLTYTLRVISSEEFRNTYQDNTIDSTTEDDNTQIMALDTSVNRFRFWPPFETTGAAAFYLHYWKYFTQLDSEADLFETPTLRPYKLFALGKYWRKRAATDSDFMVLSDRYLGDYEREVTKLNKTNNIDGGSPKSIRFNPQDFKGNRGF